MQVLKTATLYSVIIQPLHKNAELLPWHLASLLIKNLHSIFKRNIVAVYCLFKTKMGNKLHKLHLTCGLILYNPQNVLSSFLSLSRWFMENKEYLQLETRMPVHRLWFLYCPLFHVLHSLVFPKKCSNSFVYPCFSPTHKISIISGMFLYKPASNHYY